MPSVEMELWSAWMSAHDAESRARLVEHYAEWTRYMARRVFMRVRIPGMEWADFVQLATVGLLECIDRFEPARGLQFTTYARHRVRGAVLNGVRQYRGHDNWSQEAATARLRERSESLELAEQGNDLLAEIVDISVGLALGHLLDIKSLSGGHQPDAYAAADADMLMEDLSSMIDALPEREARILRYHYFQHLPFIEIAEMLGVTKGRVSQLHKQAIMRLRKELDETTGRWDLRA